MPGFCPDPCSRLVTAAVLIAIGVIQILIGIILLRSTDSYLVAGPNLMCGFANIAIACALGLTASVWTSKNKSKSVQTTARKNLVASFFLSIMIINLITVIMLLLQQLEFKNDEFVAGIESEIIASAYVTSVCSPIICIVIALVYLSGNCFKNHNYDDLGSEEKNSPYSWVYKPRTPIRAKVSDYETPGTSKKIGSVSNDNVFCERTPTSELTTGKRNLFCLSDFQSPIRTWVQKREQKLSDYRRSSPVSNEGLQPTAHFCDGPTSYGTLIPRLKESSLLRSPRDSENNESCKKHIGSQLSPINKPSKRNQREFRDGNCNRTLGGRQSSLAQPSHREYAEQFVSRRLSDSDDPIMSKLRMDVLNEMKMKVRKLSTDTVLNVVEDSGLGDEGLSPGYGSTVEVVDETRSIPRRSMKDTPVRYSRKKILRQMNTDQVAKDYKDSSSVMNAKSNLADENVFEDVDITTPQNSVFEKKNKKFTFDSADYLKHGRASESVWEERPTSTSQTASSSTHGEGSVGQRCRKVWNHFSEKANFSPKFLIRKMWANADQDKRLIPTLIVDEDSLIGLSEQELLERTMRLRNLQRAVREKLESEDTPPEMYFDDRLI